MTKKRVKNIIFNVIIRMRKPYYQGVAAELAFFFLMSMVPLTTILIELLGIFSISADIIDKLITLYVSGEVAESLRAYLIYKPSKTLSLVFIVFSLWAASKAQYSMIRIANYTYSGFNYGRGFIRERFRAIITVIITVLFLAFSLAILVYGEIFVSIINPFVYEIIGFPFRIIEPWYALRWPLGIGFYFLTISFIHYLLPSKKLPIKKLIPGSIFTSAGMLIASWIYSYYTSNFAAHNLLYGSLGTLVGLLIWFYILGLVMVLGIVLNAAWEETK